MSPTAGSPPLETTAAEVPAYVHVDGHDLFALVTVPMAGRRGVGVVVLGGGGWFPTFGRNASWTRLTRELARLGYPSVRFDYHGVGESTGHLATYRLGEPFVGEALAAVDLLRAHGVDEVVLVGMCFGARTALGCAQQVADLRGLVLFSTPMVDYDKGEGIVTAPLSAFASRAARWRAWRNLLDARKRRLYLHLVSEKAFRTVRRLRASRKGTPDPDIISALVLDPLRSLADRGIPAALVYGRNDTEWDEFTKARPVLADRGLESGDLLTVSLHDGALHGFASCTAQDVLVEEVTRWLSANIADPTSAPGPT
jgi:pimeloyl-ACP methyl ester carboxylesterase